MNYTAPPGASVYDEYNPRRTTFGDEMEPFRPSFGSSSVSYSARRDPPAWTWLENLVMPTSVYPNTPLAFLHLRRSPGGNERMVAIELNGGSGAGPLFYVRSIVLEPRSRFQPMLLRKVKLFRVSTPDALKTYAPFQNRDVRVFAGQPSPDNPARFTVEIETEGRRRTLVGTLLDDDTIGFEGGSDLVIHPVKW